VRSPPNAGAFAIRSELSWLNPVVSAKAPKNGFSSDTLHKVQERIPRSRQAIAKWLFQAMPVL
jgi:hypothetical protein